LGNLLDFIGSSMLAYQEGSLLPDVTFSQLLTSLPLSGFNNQSIHKESIADIVNTPLHRIAILIWHIVSIDRKIPRIGRFSRSDAKQ
jgi:hypothetical protein